MKTGIAPGRSRGRDRVLWLTALAGSLGALLLCLSLLPSSPGRWPMPDLAVYREGVILLIQGMDPYGRPLGIGQLPYTYPPFSLIAFSPLRYLDPTVQLTGVLSTLLLGVVIWAVLRSYPRAGDTKVLGITAPQAVLGAAILLGAQLLQPVRSNIALGQVNVVLMSMVVVDLLVVSARYRGVLTGVAAMIKLTPLIFLLFPLWTRDRRVLRNVLTACAACLTLTLVLIPRITADYFAHGMLDQNLPGHTYPGVVFNQSLRGFALRVLGPGALAVGPTESSTAAEILWIALALLVFVMLYVALRGLDRVTDAALAIGYIATAGVLVSPVSWTHHWVWFVPLATAVASSLRRYPLAVVPVTLMAVSMIGDPWFVKHWYDLGTLPPVIGTLMLNPYLWTGLLVLLVGAWYGRPCGHRADG